MYSDKFHKNSPWSDTEFNIDKMGRTLLAFMNDPDKTVIIHTKGIIMIAISEAFFSLDKVAYEVGWFADTQGRNLLKAAEEWAGSKGVKKMMLSSLFYGEEKMNKKYVKMFSRFGYEPREMCYMKELA